MKIFGKEISIFGNQKLIQDEQIDNLLSTEEIGDLLKPVFNEIPPESKIGEYLRDGLQSWAYIAISAIADEISTIDYDLYQRKGDKWTEIENHAFLSLWEKPNPVQTRAEFNWLLSVLFLGAGEVPILLDQAKNPTSMIILNPEKLTVKYDATKIVGGYTYTQSDGKRTDYEADRIILIKAPSVSSPFRGRSTLKYIAKTIDLDNFIETYMNTFFYNSATPSGVIETDKQLSNEVINRLRSQFEARHRGVKKAHKINVLELGLKFNNTTFKISDLQAIELQNSIRDKVFAVFRVPKSVVGIVEDVNRANAEASMLTFGRNAIKPRLKMIEGQINQFLLPKFSDGQNLWFEFENPVQEDKMAEAQYYQTMVNSGILTANEIRVEMGLKEIQDIVADEETVVEDNNDEEIETPPTKAMQKKFKTFNKRRGAFEEKTTEVEKIEKKINGKIETAVAEFLKVVYPNTKKTFTIEEKDAYHNEKIVFSDQLEVELKKKLFKYFKGMEKRLLSQIKSVKSVKAVTPQVDAEQELALFIKVITPYYGKSIELQSALTYWLLGHKDKLPQQDDLVKEFIKDNSNKVGNSVLLTTNDDIKNIVTTWNEESGDLTELRGMIGEYFDGTEKNRAENIARTEISRANGFATEEVYKRLEVVGKEWVTARDEKTCPFCNEMDGVVIPTGDSFWDKGDTMEVVDNDGNVKSMDFGFSSIEEYPLHPSCRCDLFPVFNEVDIPADPFAYKINKQAIKIKELEAEKEKVAKEAGEILIERQKNRAKEAELELKEKELKKSIKEVKAIKKELNG